MNSLAEDFDIVIGVDTHKHTHTAAVVNAATTGPESTLVVAADPGGFEQLAAACGSGRRRVWAIEGCGSWGRGLAVWLQARGETVVETERAKRLSRRMGRKDDTIDAYRAALDALANTRQAVPCQPGQRDAVAAVLAARRSALQAATDTERQLHALAVTAPEYLAGKLRGHNTRQIVTTCARWRPDTISDTATQMIAVTMRRMARRVTELRDEVNNHERALTQLVRAWRPDLLDQPGIGPIVAGTILTAWSHPGRFHSEAAFAMLAGVAPIPASSGQTVRHRLNRHGNRELNWAIHIIVLHRSRYDEATRAYIDRRTQQGKTPRETRRCLKRYIARQIFNLLEKPLDMS